MIRAATKLKPFADQGRPGVIKAGAVYTLPEFMGRTGFSKSAMREARRKGLKVRRIGKRGFVLGKDAIEFIEACGKVDD